MTIYLDNMLDTIIFFYTQALGASAASYFDATLVVAHYKFPRDPRHR